MARHIGAEEPPHRRMAASSGMTDRTVNPGPWRDARPNGGAGGPQAPPGRRSVPKRQGGRQPGAGGPGRYSREGVPAWHRTHGRGGTVSTYPDHILRMGSQHLAELKRKAAEFERQLWDAHESLEYEMGQSSFAPEGTIDARQEAFSWSPDDGDPGGTLPAGPVPVRVPADPASVGTEPAAPAYSPEDRTAGLVSHGRQPATRRHRLRGILLAAIAAAAVAALVTVLVAARVRPQARLARQRGQGAAADRGRVPEPGRGFRTQPGQLRLRQGHPADSLGLLAADQRQQPRLRLDQDQAGRAWNLSLRPRAGRWRGR